MRREKKKRDRKRKSRQDGKKMVSDSASEEDSGDTSDRPRRSVDNPEDVIKLILTKFPGVTSDLEQLLKMIDDGQAVDIRGLSEKSLVRYLKKLFLSLNLKEKDDLVFLLPSNVPPTLDVVGPIVRRIEQNKHQLPSEEKDDANILPLDTQMKDETNNNTSFPIGPCPQEDPASSRKRVIGPEMPSAELLAAAAKLTEAEAELREAELNDDVGDFIGPPPPAMVKEAESANEAERFEEVTRIMAVEGDSPYDVVGVNRNMVEGNIKKRYWKLSLMVHPDKCSHPQAQEAFVRLNKAFKDLQDPDKRKAMDDKIKLKEEQESLKAEMKEMRDAAHWRRLQGISMEGDDILLAELDVKVETKRDEWMTKLPPERKPGVPTQSTQFSRTNKDGRGDTSAWTDTPSDRAQKAKINYLEAYNKAAELALNVEERAKMETDRKLVEDYNKVKRSKTLVEMHQESAKSKSKKKNKKGEGGSTEEWEGQHPWKPWDREKDLTAGRLNVKLDPDNMAQGLSSRFSSTSFQKSFL
jgi:curved DNA-binding protein CbpA